LPEFVLPYIGTVLRPSTLRDTQIDFSHLSLGLVAFSHTTVHRYHSMTITTVSFPACVQPCIFHIELKHTALSSIESRPMCLICRISVHKYRTMSHSTPSVSLCRQLRSRNSSPRNSSRTPLVAAVGEHSEALPRAGSHAPSASHFTEGGGGGHKEGEKYKHPPMAAAAGGTT
jgi:hypothetical protein